MSDATSNNKMASPGNSDNTFSSNRKYLPYSTKIEADPFGTSIAL